MSAVDIAVALEQENADLRRRVADALAVVEDGVPETCYEPDSMEYFAGPCPRCQLRAHLTVPDMAAADAAVVSA